MHTISDDEGDILLSESRKALYPLIGDENCVIIGRCANYAFSDRQDKISIFLSGDKSDRIRHIAKKHDFSERRRRLLLTKLIQEEESFINTVQTRSGAMQLFMICV